MLVADPRATAIFEAALAAEPGLAPKAVANWVTGEYLRLAKAAAGAGEGSGAAFDATVLTAEAGGTGAQLGRLVRLVAEGAISGTNAKQVFERHATSGEPVDEIVADLGLAQISDRDALVGIIDEVLAANPAAVADVRAGKGQASGFLVGQVMKATRGQAQASVVQALLRERLGLD